ncbi:MAG: DUF998 domain-containing protein [Bacteroidetes bacterium]|nr:MAG: DUF998 domain-containing protein [Bacteroidota bacterium]
MVHDRFSTLTHSYIALRKSVGWIGILLPFVLALGLFVFFDAEGTEPSISHYYHTKMGNVFVGSLCAVALFLFFYCGYDKRDDWAGNIAGFFAICVAWIPTTETDPTDLTGFVHFACAAIFFSTLAYFSIFLFTKSKKGETPTKEKLARNKIYVGCGIVMIACLLSIVLYSFVKCEGTSSSLIFWAESIALMAFGISWLTKGETIFPDVEEENANSEEE